MKDIIDDHLFKKHKRYYVKEIDKSFDRLIEVQRYEAEYEVSCRKIYDTVEKKWLEWLA